jgi:outer membrane scaffolding protein for murein synthesis (MipA/OmpV family)
MAISPQRLYSFGVKSFFCLLLLISINGAFSATKELPLWEFGLGALPFRADNYRGSPQHKWYLFHLVSYTYRGKNVEAENGYVRGHLIKYKNFTFDLSFSIGLNVNSDSDRLRKGMKDLDPTFEIGPMLRYYLWKSKDDHHYINLEMPYRAVYTSDLSYIDQIGYYSIPYINYLTRARDSTFGWAAEVSLGPTYGSAGYHHHFYGVNSRDATPERPLYQGKRGYGGTSLGVILSKRLGEVLMIPFLRYDYLDGAIYQDGPLFKNRHYTMYGLAFIWYFSRSSRAREAPTMVK